MAGETPFFKSKARALGLNLKSQGQRFLILAFLFPLLIDSNLHAEEIVTTQTGEAAATTIADPPCGGAHAQAQPIPEQLNCPLGGTYTEDTPVGCRCLPEIDEAQKELYQKLSDNEAG